MKLRNTVCLVLGLGLIICVGGCEDDPAASVDQPYTAKKPAHPAMTAMTSKAAPEQSVSQPGMQKAPPPAPAEAKGNLVARLRQYHLTVEVPEEWTEEAPNSAFRMATFRLPKVEGDAEGAELSVSAAGGTIDANVSRWRRQFAENPEPTQRAIKTPGGMNVTLVELEGTFSAGRGAKGTEPKTGTKMLAAIVAIPHSQNLLFFKAWGPKKTMDHWSTAFEGFVNSLKHQH